MTANLQAARDIQTTRDIQTARDIQVPKDIQGTRELEAAKDPSPALSQPRASSAPADSLDGFDRLRDLAERYTAAWCSQDAESVAAHFALNGTLAMNGNKPAIGREAIAAVAQSFMEAFPDLRIAMDDLRIRDGELQYHWTLTGNNTGPGGDGKRVQISGWEEWQMSDDGLIAESQGHFDEADYQRQLSGF